MHFVGFVKELDMALLTVFEIRLSNLLARKFQNYNIYIDSIEKIWQKSLVRINFHWPWATGPLLKSKTGLKLIHFLVLKVYCKSKVWLAEWNNMSTRRQLFQSADTMNIQLSVLVYGTKRTSLLSKCNLFLR